MKRISKLSGIVFLLGILAFPAIAKTTQTNKFPSIQGTNLNDKKYNIPEDMKAKYNLLLVAFKRDHQKSVDTWLPLATELSKKYSNFKFYELPILGSNYRLIRGFIDGGMRSGIPDKNVRERTITAYIPKSDFLKSLNLSDDTSIQVFLLDDNGNILWKSHGDMNDKNKQEAENFMNNQEK